MFDTHRLEGSHVMSRRSLQEGIRKKRFEHTTDESRFLQVPGVLDRAPLSSTPQMVLCGHS